MKNKIIRIVDPTEWIDWEYLIGETGQRSSKVTHPSQIKANMLLAINNLRRAFPEYSFKFGDQIILSTHEDAADLIAKIKKERASDPHFLPFNNTPVLDLLSALQDASVCSVWCYGSADVYDFKKSRSQMLQLVLGIGTHMRNIEVNVRKPFITYCGLSILLNILEQYGLARSVHGPLVGHFGLHYSDTAIQDESSKVIARQDIIKKLNCVFQGENNETRFDNVKITKPLIANTIPDNSEGVLLGGLLQVVVLYLQLVPFFEYFIHAQIKQPIFLLIEFYEVGNEEKMVKALIKILNQKKWPIQAIVFGGSKSVHKQADKIRDYQDKISQLKQQIQAVCCQSGILVVDGLTVGHGFKNIPLRLGPTVFKFTKSEQGNNGALFVKHIKKSTHYLPKKNILNRWPVDKAINALAKKVDILSFVDRAQKISRQKSSYCIMLLLLVAGVGVLLFSYSQSFINTSMNYQKFA